MVAQVHSAAVVRRVVSGEAPRRRPILGATLWGVQALLALLFLFAGGVKFAMPIEVLEQGGLPGAFVLFIGYAALCERL